MEFTKYGITETPKLIYNNPLASKSDIDGFVLEVQLTFHFLRASFAWKTA